MRRLGLLCCFNEAGDEFAGIATKENMKYLKEQGLDCCGVFQSPSGAPCRRGSS